MTQKDREKMRSFYDDLGEKEWRRHDDSPRGRVAYLVHQHFLERFVRAGDDVLEVGAGPGRLTFDLARLGAHVAVTDFSPVQLELHRQHLSGTEAETSVRSRDLLDICDTSRYEDDTFDVVLAFGGPLSYAFENAEDALRGLFRITRPAGYVVASVMSLLGSWRYFLPFATSQIVSHEFDQVMTTGDLRFAQDDHVCQMFRSSDVVAMVERCGGELVAQSASNWASLSDPDALESIEAEPEHWERFLAQEIRACAEPGAVDGGTHLLFAIQVR